MPFWKLYYHFVWATRNREPIIPLEHQQELYLVIAAKARQLQTTVYAVGGTDDHVHLAVSVPPRLSLSDLIGQVKGNSSHWVNHVLTLPYQFAWQSEYGVVSFGGKHLDTVKEYIANQRQHHQGGTVIAFLERTE